MGNQLQQGDSAVIIGAFSLVENIGRGVELIHFIPPFGEAFCQDGYFEADGDGLWIVSGEDLARNAEGGKVISNLAGCAPQHLRPLRGDFEPEQQKQRKAEPCA